MVVCMCAQGSLDRCSAARSNALFDVYNNRFDLSRIGCDLLATIRLSRQLFPASPTAIDNNVSIFIALAILSR